MTNIIENAPLTPEEKADRAAWEAGEYERAVEAVNESRLNAYRTESDPIFFQYQRGEKTEQEWLDAVKAVNDANPYPPTPKA